jgi:hypothetical protein
MCFVGWHLFIDFDLGKKILIAYITSMGIIKAGWNKKIIP